MQLIHTLRYSVVLRCREAFVRGVVWAFIGVLYGMSFLFFCELAKAWALPIQPCFFAGAMAGTVVALIYSSMRLAVLLAAIISPFCLFLFIFAIEPIDPGRLLLTVVPVGAVIGALYGLLSRSSRVYRADAKILTGFSAGFLTALGYLILFDYTHNAPVAVVVALMCIATGWLYVLLAPLFVRFFDNLLPPVGDGTLVGAGVAVFLGLCFFIMITSFNGATAVVGAMSLIEHINEQLPQAVTGGLLGGALAGLVSGLMLTKWQDL